MATTRKCTTSITAPNPSPNDNKRSCRLATGILINFSIIQLPIAAQEMILYKPSQNIISVFTISIINHAAFKLSLIATNAILYKISQSVVVVSIFFTDTDLLYTIYPIGITTDTIPRNNSHRLLLVANIVL